MINFEQSNLDNLSKLTLENFISSYLYKYCDLLKEEIIDLDTEIQYLKNYTNKAETIRTFKDAVKVLCKATITYGDKVKFDVRPCKRKGLSMYIDLTFDVDKIPLDTEGRGKLGKMTIRVSDHYNPDRHCRYNFVLGLQFNYKKLNDIKDEIKQIIDNHLEEIETFKKEHGITETLKLKIRET